MIITCPCDKKKFEVDASLIPDYGRNMQCGACGHVWFYKKEDEYKVNDEKAIISEEIDKKNQIPENTSPKKVKKQIFSKEKSGTEIVEYTPKTTFTFGKFLSYIIVLIISFAIFIILIDTLKTPLIDIFPKLEILLFNLFETLQDIKLFIIDLS